MSGCRSTPVEELHAQAKPGAPPKPQNKLFVLARAEGDKWEWDDPWCVGTTPPPRYKHAACMLPDGGARCFIESCAEFYAFKSKLSTHTLVEESS